MKSKEDQKESSLVDFDDEMPHNYSNYNKKSSGQLEKGSKDSDDSFGNDMENIYNQQIKNSQNQNQFEIQNKERPVSKYTRERINSAKSMNKKQEDGMQVEEEITKEKLVEKINDFLQKNQITKKDFADNQNEFMNKNDMKEMFKENHLQLTSNEVDFLFENNNPNKNDGYIYFSAFLEYYNFNFFPGDSTLINKSKESSQSAHSLLLNNNKPKPPLKEEINIRFADFKNDIMDIVKKTDIKSKKKKKLPPVSAISHKLNKTQTNMHENSINEANNRIMDFDNNNSKKITIANRETTKGDKKKEDRPRNYFLKKTLERQQLEEEMIRLTIEKRDKEFQRECVRKMVQANEYAEQLGIAKSYSALAEEGENSIICRVFDKKNKDYTDENLKQFLIEFKKLEKLINQKKESENYKEQKIDKKEKEVKKSEKDFFRMTREEKHKKIKEILRESIQLKLQLKRQLKALREKGIIDVATINKNLKLTNLDDNTLL